MNSGYRRGFGDKVLLHGQAEDLSHIFELEATLDAESCFATHFHLYCFFDSLSKAA